MLIHCYQLNRKEVKKHYLLNHFLPWEGSMFLLVCESKIKCDVTKIRTSC